MSRRTVLESALVLLVTLAVALVPAWDTRAGQFKRLTGSEILAPGAQIQAHASPRNQGTAMEIDVYEWIAASAAAPVPYRCRIILNLTGQRLNLRMIGADGSIFSSCVAPSGGSCDVPTGFATPKSLHQCTVATQGGAPVLPTAHYILAIQRL
ncbi:MAG TPA: hypothetical protein VGW35_25950 [Methylomirabilota bacterium]|jgi:hypothetical protein|nr:hypothetical protein [Methylomirabilota bacterium]